jgi:hypothetical protein
MVFLAVCCVVVSQVYITASDATTAYDKSREWILNTASLPEDAATHLWNESSHWIQNTTADAELFFQNGMDKVEIGYNTISGATTMWVSDSAKTVHLTLVDSGSAVISTLAEIIVF